MAYRAEHAVDLETGAVVAVTVATGDAGDTATILVTLPQAGEHIAEVACATNNEAVGERVHPEGPREAVTDKGYHSNDTLQVLAEADVRSYKSRGYCLEMMCADFLAGAHMESGDPKILLFSMLRLFRFLPAAEKQEFVRETT